MYRKIGLITATLLILTGCASTDSPKSFAPNGDPGAENAAPGSNSDSKNTATEEAPATLSGHECMVGSWSIPEAEMQGFYDAIDVPIDFTVNGTMTWNFASDTYEYLPDFSLTIDMGVAKAIATISGSTTGEYTADSGVIKTSHEVSNADVTVKVGDMITDETAAFDNLVNTFAVNQAPYTCEGDELVIMMQTGDTDAERSPMTLTRR